MKFNLYYTFKVIVKCGLFFYSKKITVNGTENIPENEAVLFTANHPNGLLDPLLIAANIKRRTYFLVQAAVFSNTISKKIFQKLGMMPIYRIRDGIGKLDRNKQIFLACEELFLHKNSILIFPEGSHQRKRTIRPLSKGFTRFVFSFLDKYPQHKIYIVPVGITYQNPAVYPSSTSVNFGKPILANKFYNTENTNQSANEIKQEVSLALQKLSVNIPNNENYSTIENTLIRNNVDFTKVTEVNQQIAKSSFKVNPKKQYSLGFLKLLIIVNTLIPYILWKVIRKKINEVEFLDTFRFSVNLVLVFVNYLLVSIIIGYIFNLNAAYLYFLISLLLVVTFTKFSATKPG